ncbi:hypothetical protein QYF50_06510 [Paenibacillus vini]|uniref:hypothetical protein n=1 Tax=Paenibacillus vini TaxID=1476024 RepID=UPI0025B67E3B|nr:hypothetical protein [Paenibacillus vini]MDN4067543.1 hypothetical protein [Paenibacillus vini]
MLTTNERPFDGGTLVVTNVPTEKCDCDEQILLGDSALMAGYARLLADSKIIGNVTVSFDDLQQKFSVQDFMSKSVKPS